MDQPCARRGSFFCNDSAIAEICPVALHDALPIWGRGVGAELEQHTDPGDGAGGGDDGECGGEGGRSRRQNCSHTRSSHAGFCLDEQSEKRRGTWWGSFFWVRS